MTRKYAFISLIEAEGIHKIPCINYSGHPLMWLLSTHSTACSAKWPKKNCLIIYTGCFSEKFTYLLNSYAILDANFSQNNHSVILLQFSYYFKKITFANQNGQDFK